ncbi:hypothetical protein KP509_01G055300 [Ceratopteris richardii]|uniref:Uncharacterized protein n=2 Tax=Ceratopteris richardii TaxID=49495 RepID=A0A8T2VKX7_CERRI|nr:hypothetical protein KP509_01G055300 [Ceratopteris richardii]
MMTDRMHVLPETIKLFGLIHSHETIRWRWTYSEVDDIGSIYTVLHLSEILCRNTFMGGSVHSHYAPGYRKSNQLAN